MTTPDEARLCAFLDEIGVAHEVHHHEPVFTVEESKHVTSHLPGAHTKNMFLKEKKGGYWLVTCLQDRKIRIKHLEKAVGAKRLSFASAEDLETKLGVQPGSVTPFAAFNDEDCEVRVVLDAQMMGMEPQNFHPLHNAATIVVRPDGLRAFFAAMGHQPTEIDFDELERLSAE